MNRVDNTVDISQNEEALIDALNAVRRELDSWWMPIEPIWLREEQRDLLNKLTRLKLGDRRR